MYLLGFRRSVPHVHEHATGLGLRRGQHREAARAKSEERFRASEIVFHRAYERDYGGASDARVPDNELHGRHRQNFEPDGSAEAHRYFALGLRRDRQRKICQKYRSVHFAEKFVKRLRVKYCLKNKFLLLNPRLNLEIRFYYRVF